MLHFGYQFGYPKSIFGFVTMPCQSCITNFVDPFQHFSHGLLPSTLQINAANAQSFKFKGAEHFSQVAMATEDGILVDDGGRLALNDSGMAGKEEFYQ